MPKVTVVQQSTSVCSAGFLESAPHMTHKAASCEGSVLVTRQRNPVTAEQLNFRTPSFPTGVSSFFS